MKLNFTKLILLHIIHVIVSFNIISYNKRKWFTSKLQSSIIDISQYRDIIPVEFDHSSVSCYYLNGVCNVFKTDSTIGK